MGGKINTLFNPNSALWVSQAAPQPSIHLYMKTLPFLARALVLTASLFAGICSAQTAGKPSAAFAQPTLDEVLSWLPADTETVIGATGPFPLPGPSSKPDDPDHKMSNTELKETMEALPLGLFETHDGDLLKLLKGKTVTLAVEGSRHFRPPRGLGGMLYQGCEIAVFGDDIADQGDAFMKSAPRSAKRVQTIAGLPVAVFEEKLEDDIWTIFVAFPGKKIVAVATNVDYLQTVLIRMKGTTGPRALPESLPEWKYVNTRALVWGVRHYDRTQARLDPTSPLQGQSAANVPDTAAVGVAFHVDGGEANVTYVSGNRDARQFLQSVMNAGYWDGAPTLEPLTRWRQPSPGAVQCAISISDAEVFLEMLFGLLAMLGHAVYV